MLGNVSKLDKTSSTNACWYITACIKKRLDMALVQLRSRERCMPLVSGQRGHAKATQLRAKRRAVAARSGAAASMVVVYPAEQESQFRGVPWEDVFDLMKVRFAWENDVALSLHTFSSSQALDSAQNVPKDDFEAACKESDLFLAVDVRDELSTKAVNAAQRFQWPAFIVLDSPPEMTHQTSLAGLPVTRLPAWALTALAKLPEAVPWATAATAWPMLLELWGRRSSDDLAFMLMLAINDFVTPVPCTQVNMGDLRSLGCMLTKCREQVLACVNDPQCKAALDGLASCGLNDQVCSYRVLASYESPLLEDFSKCILQKNNCLRNSADIPMTPDPAPLAAFRGVPLTHTAAEDIFIGHLAEQAPDRQDFSWRVASGKNPAYDFFPCQFQLWYRARGTVMWYDPIFKVQTLDGRVVWRRRHYRVRRAEVPGTFYFSVLDNGVTSNEYWKIMDCAEDFSWAVFYYSGAASTAGITYRGALICTPTGRAPQGAAAQQRVDAALAACGIRRWEMYAVDNKQCTEAPLSVPDYGNIQWRELAAPEAPATEAQETNQTA
eukprot:jgi/Ulvmu1/3924/UM018_0147.1